MPTPRKTIDALVDKPVLAGTERLVIQDGGVSKRATVSNLLKLPHTFTEIADPVGVANQAIVYARDSAGKTQLCVRFGTGAPIVIATEP
jgi:hypothetical protein